MEFLRTPDRVRCESESRHAHEDEYSVLCSMLDHPRLLSPGSAAFHATTIPVPV